MVQVYLNVLLLMPARYLGSIFRSSKHLVIDAFSVALYCRGLENWVLLLHNGALALRMILVLLVG